MLLHKSTRFTRNRPCSTNERQILIQFMLLVESEEKLRIQFEDRQLMILSDIFGNIDRHAMSMSIFDGSRLPFEIASQSILVIFRASRAMICFARLQFSRSNFHFSSLFALFFHRYRDPCSLSLNEDDNHTITLVGNANKRAVTLAKTCEQVNELRDCRAPRDWSILALQNTRTGKSHYLVICKCPSHFRLGELNTFRSCSHYCYEIY